MIVIDSDSDSERERVIATIYSESHSDVLKNGNTLGVLRKVVGNYMDSTGVLWFPEEVQLTV